YSCIHSVWCNCSGRTLPCSRSAQARGLRELSEFSARACTLTRTTSPWSCGTKVPMQSFLVSHAIYAIVLFGVLEAMCIPISSELTFLLGGAIASGGVAGTSQHPSLALVIILGTVAELVGSFISYYVGRVGGKPLVRR